MKTVILSSLVVLFAIASMVAIAPEAFAATVTNAPGSSTPGCEDTAEGCFIPSPVTIDIGETVTWENNDTAAHTATGGSAADGPSGVFDSSLIMAGSSFSHTFDSVGTYDYFCMVHPWMSGTVIVEDAAAAEAAAEAAAAESLAALEAAAAESLAAAEAAAEAAAAMAAPAIDAADYISASGASITSITANADDDSVIIVIDAVDDGELNVILSDKVIKAFDDGSYFVLVNNEEVEFSQTGNNLTIPYEAGNDTIEIVGSYAIPEFGTIAMIVLAVAIVSIIVITTKTRTSLIPKL
jgi:predicted secreted protein with PEFG-CTERM motif